MDETSKLSNLVQIPGGGQKKVYMADHPEYGKVVYKIIHPNSDSLERTVREIRAVKLIDSNSIPNIHCSNAELPEANPIWIIEEFIPGKTLRTHIREGRKFTINEIVKFLLTMIDITILSEENNLVHRDIKPENIMLDDHGNFWLLDFGIARHLDLKSITDSKSPFGLFTFGYASSEQFRNLKKNIDIRCDLFSIGVVAYELIQGENFYIKDSNNDVFQILKKLENFSIPNQRIEGDAQFQLSTFIRLLGDHRRYRRPRTAVQAKEILTTVITTINLN